MQTQPKDTQSKPNQKPRRSKTAPVDEATGKTQVEQLKPISGIVTDCLKLNIREAPEADADIVSVISALTEVVIDMDNSTDTFYKVCTAAGIQGFCKKQFIAVRK